MVFAPAWWLALGGALAGLAGASAWGWWCQTEQAAWREQRDALQARQTRQTTAQARAAQAARQQGLMQQLQARQREWQTRREQILRLHAVLDQAALDAGLRLQQWQGQAQGLQMQASLPRARDWSSLQQRLDAAGPQAWRLHTLGTRLDDDGLQLVLQSPWRESVSPTRAEP